MVGFQGFVKALLGLPCFRALPSIKFPCAGGSPSANLQDVDPQNPLDAQCSRFSLSLLIMVRLLHKQKPSNKKSQGAFCWFF